MSIKAKDELIDVFVQQRVKMSIVKSISFVD